MVVICYILILIGLVLCALLIHSERERRIWKHIAKIEQKRLEETFEWFECFYRLP